MKTLFTLLALLATLLPATALKPGDPLKPDALAKADFLKGEPFKEWEKDKLYLIVCWATESSPSIATLPLIDDYHREYEKQGLLVIAVNVGENDREKVAKFVASQREALSHPVAFVPSGETFQTEWLEPAGVKSIPHAFVVKNGTLILHDHPAKVGTEAIKALLAGGKQQQDWLDERERKAVSREVITAFLRDYSTAQAAGNADAMEAAIAEIAGAQPDFVHLERMQVEVAMTRKDWKAAKAGLDAISDPHSALTSAAILSRKYDTAEEQPPAELFESVVRIFTEHGQDDPSVKASLARVQWKLGRKEEALAAARLAALNPGTLPKPPLEAFAKSFEEGDPQTLEELIAAVGAASRQAPGR
ncbi:MAG: TlpA disulfide reductase family protein [Verrucomicrobiota bacterium]